MKITNSNQSKTWAKLKRLPIPNDIPWTDIESLMKHVGCDISYGRGSRVSFKYGSEILHTHSPHPERQIPPEVAKRIWNFLIDIGVE